MHNAVERAKAALAQNGQKPGSIRYANLDIGQIMGIMQYNAAQLETYVETTQVTSGGNAGSRDKVSPPPPPVQPGKITVSATVQCAFQIQS